jgi:flagellar assembly factor FliW
MVFNSKVHGLIEYEEKDILTFNKGILGFEDLRKFILIDLKEYEPFKLFHSLEDDELGIVVTSPYEFFEEYQVKLSNDVIEHLGIKKPEDTIIVTTVTLNSDPKKITTNLQGPIIINSVNNLGEQIIVDNGKYKVKEPLMKE